MKVGVELGLTICTDAETRNFARFGFSINDIDTEGDIEEQANAGVSAVLKTFEVADEGMAEAVSVALTDLRSAKPDGVREELDTINDSLDHIRSALIPNIVAKVIELDQKVDSVDSGGSMSQDDVLNIVQDAVRNAVPPKLA